MKIAVLIIALLVLSIPAFGAETVKYLSASALVTTGAGAVKSLIAYDNGSADCTLQPYDNPSAAADGQQLPAAISKSGNGMGGIATRVPYYRGLYITVTGTGCTGYVIYDNGQ